MKLRPFCWLWSYRAATDTVHVVGYRGPLDKSLVDRLVPADSDLARWLRHKYLDEINNYLKAPFPAVAPTHRVDIERYNERGDLRNVNPDCEETVE